MAYSFDTSPNTAFSPFVLISSKSVIPNDPTADECESETTLLAAFPGSGAFASEWVLIGKIEQPLSVNPESQTIETTDGSTIVTSEQITIEMNDLNFTQYPELRDATDGVHRKKCHVVLVDPANLTKTVKIKDLNLMVMPEIGEMQKIKITGSKKTSNLDNIFSIFTPA